MDFFIQSVWAQDAATAGGGSFASLLPLVILFVVFYFLLIRPQTKRAKEHQKMVESLAKGDEVVTSGGLLGKITQIGDNFVMLELAENLEVKVQRYQIAAVMPKGTLKNTL